MKLIYTDHLKTRLKQREISLNLVKEIFDKNVLAAYDIIKKVPEVITIHPITDEEIKSRLLSERWSYEKNKN